MQDVLTNNPNRRILNSLAFNRSLSNRRLSRLDRLLNNRLSSHRSLSNNLLVAIKLRSRVSVRLRRHRQREARSGAANLFRAVLADGSRVKGMVFPGELVWDAAPPPRGHARLVGKDR